MTRIDAHCHFWQPERGDYHWLTNGPPALDPLRRAFGPDELAALNDQRQVIVVQAAETIAETRYLLDLAAAFPQILGVIGWVDLSEAKSVGVLEDLARSPWFKGIRPMLQDLEDDSWIATRPQPEVIEKLQSLGLRFDALVKTRHLPALLQFTAQWPELPVIIDHAAKPDLSGTALDPRWVSGMAALAAAPQIWCKLSGLLTELPADQLAAEKAIAALRPVFDHLLDCFGAERLIWGSDWPVVTLAGDHGLWEQITEGLLEGLTQDQRRAILGENAKLFYGLGGHHG